MSEHVSFRIENSLHYRFEKYCKKTGTTKSRVMQSLIRRFLVEKEKEAKRNELAQSNKR